MDKLRCERTSVLVIEELNCQRFFEWCIRPVLVITIIHYIPFKNGTFAELKRIDSQCTDY
jgi:hypothetical protein